MFQKVIKWFDSLEQRIEDLSESKSTIDTTKAAVQKIPLEIALSAILGFGIGTVGYPMVLYFGFAVTLKEVVGGVIGAALFGTMCIFGSLKS